MVVKVVHIRPPESRVQKPGSQEARKPGSQEARKPGSQEARKPGSQEASVDQSRNQSQLMFGVSVARREHDDMTYSVQIC